MPRINSQVSSEADLGLFPSSQHLNHNSGKEPSLPFIPTSRAPKAQEQEEEPAQIPERALAQLCEGCLLISAAEKGRALEHKQGAPELMLSPE